MKTAKCLFVFAAAFTLSFSAFGATGAEAAGGISSDPFTVFGERMSDSWDIIAAGYDKQSKEVTYNPITIREGNEWDDIKSAVDAIGANLTSAAANSLQALAKIALLEGETEWLKLSIKALEYTTREAIESLDTLTLKDVDNAITKVLTKQPKADDGKSGITYIGGNIFNVAGAQADGKSIASNSNDRLEIKGFSDSTTTTMKIPCKGTQNLLWSNIGYWGDGKSIGEKDSGGNYLSFISIAGWDAPGTYPHRCAESIAAMLKRTESDPAPTPEQNPANHLVLTRYSGEANPVIHFTPLGSLGAVGGGAIKFWGTDQRCEIVGSGSVTNNVRFAHANDSNVSVLVSRDDNNDVLITIGVYYK